jgi:hypothetical protein
LRAGSFKFIDLPTAAERLGTSRNQLLQWMAEGRIKPFSGSGQQSVFRSADVDRLAQELGTEAQAAPSSAPESQAPTPETAGTGSAHARARKRDPIKLIGTRISMDSRWAEITDADIATWLDALEPVQFERVRNVCGLAVDRLRYVVAALDEQERNLRTGGNGRQQ